MQKKRTRRPQERGQKTREVLLLAAVESLVQNNIYGLRFAQIAKLAKVPQPLMDYHFPSLEALLMDMVQHQLEKLKVESLEAIQAHLLKPRKALEAYIRAPFKLAEKDAGFRAVWSGYYHLATVDKTFADLNLSIRRVGHERIFTLIVSILQAEGKSDYLTRGKLLNNVATSIQGIVTGNVIMAWAEGKNSLSAMADLAVKASAQLLAENFP